MSESVENADPALDLTLLGVWGARGETPETIADRTRQTLDAITGTLGIGGWLTSEDTPFDTDPQAQAEVVRRGVDRDADDVDNPSAGTPSPCSAVAR